MPRQRKPDPSIPGHIDQRKLPVGVYWDRRDHYWYTITHAPKAKRSRIAAADALMSDLHAAMELSRGIDSSSLDYMLALFEESGQFKREIGEATRDDYRYCRLAIQRHPTKLGVKFAYLSRAMIKMPLLQKLINDIAEKHPSKANHVARYLSVAYQWGMQNGYAIANPAQGLRKAQEMKAHRMPKREVMRAVIALLRERGAMPARRVGSVAPYVWAVAEIAYQCRMRSVEVRMLTDASATDDGIRVERVKGSLDTIVKWCPELRDAWGWLVSRRARIWLKRPALRAMALRPLIVSEDGAALSKSALNSAWRRAMAVSIETCVIAADQKFGLHGLKHRGVTDTPGNKADKKQASGHKSDAMAILYDHAIAVVEPAGKRD